MDIEPIVPVRVQTVELSYRVTTEVATGLLKVTRFNTPAPALISVAPVAAEI